MGNERQGMGMWLGRRCRRRRPSRGASRRGARRRRQFDALCVSLQGPAAGRAQRFAGLGASSLVLLRPSSEVSRAALAGGGGGGGNGVIAAAAAAVREGSRGQPYAALQAWLLEVTTALLDPAESEDPASPTKDSSFSRRSGSMRAAAAAAAQPAAAAAGSGAAGASMHGIASMATLGVAAAAAVAASAAATVTAGTRLGAGSSQEERFRYVTRLVSRARIWREDEGALFDELKDVVQGFMDRVALECDQRFRELCCEPMGLELAAFNASASRAGAARVATVPGCDDGSGSLRSNGSVQTAVVSGPTPASLAQRVPVDAPDSPARNWSTSNTAADAPSVRENSDHVDSSNPGWNGDTENWISANGHYSSFSNLKGGRKGRRRKGFDRSSHENEDEDHVKPTKGSVGGGKTVNVGISPGIDEAEYDDGRNSKCRINPHCDFPYEGASRQGYYGDAGLFSRGFGNGLGAIHSTPWWHMCSATSLEFSRHLDGGEYSCGDREQLTPIGGSIDGPSRGSHWLAELQDFAAALAPAVRQDDAQVRAVRVVEDDLRESALLPDGLRDEEVFLAQLHRRSRLLNQGILLAVTAVLHRNSAGFNIFPSIGRSLSSPERRWSAVGMDSFSSWRTNAFQCSFTDGAQGLVGVHPAPVKTVTRMREKLSKYAPPHPAARWPLSANILDPVRLSIVCQGPSQMLQVAHWFVIERAQRSAVGLHVCRIKNKFAFDRQDVLDGYRDLKVYTLFTGEDGGRIIGEIQV